MKTEHRDGCRCSKSCRAKAARRYYRTSARIGRSAGVRRGTTLDSAPEDVSDAIDMIGEVLHGGIRSHATL